MNFIINIDTGNKEQDVWNTINNFSQEQLQQFIESITLKRDNSTIVGRAIFFRYPDGKALFESIEDISKVPLSTRKKIKERTYRLNTEDLFIGLHNKENIKSDLVRKIINKIANKINIRKKFSEVLSNDKYNSNFYNLCFTIISSDEYFNKFLNYDKNISLFGKKYTQEDYVIELSKILGYQENDISKTNSVYKYNFITSDMINRYLKLRKLINIDIKMLGDKLFNQGDKTSYSKEYQFQIDNDWQVNPQMLEYIMEDIEPEYNTLEKISHIYIKICQALRYNLGYHIKKWSTEYNKNRQEAITPNNNEIICSEFSFLATNIINKLDSNIEARCIITGKEQHLSFGIVDKTKQIRINFDGTKIFNEFDDLGRVKIGLPLVGIDYICDRNNEFKNAFEKVYNKLCKNNQIETQDLIEAYEKLRSKKEIPIDVYENLCIFFDRMKDKNIVGSELLGAFKRMIKQGFFGNISYSIVGEDKKLNFAERHKLETPQEILDGLEENIIIQNGNEYYLLKLNDCKIILMSIDELNMLFEEDKMVYFNPNHRIEGIGVKSCMKR